MELYSVASPDVNLLISAWHEAGELYLQINNGSIAQISSGTTQSLSTENLAFGSITNTSACVVVGDALIYNASLPEATREAIQSDLNDIYEFWS